MSKLKIYVASPFAQIERVKTVHKLIQAAGMEFTSRWAEEPITGESHEIAEKAFQMDRADLARSNALLALIDIPGGRETFCEIEVARLTGIPIVFVGKPHMSLEREWMLATNIFVSSAENEFDAVEILKNNWDLGINGFVKVPSPYYEFANEREKQDKKWGEQNHSSVEMVNGKIAKYNIPTDKVARKICQDAARNGMCTWTDIALEEFCESVYAKDDVDRRKELVQLGAVITAWIECIDRKANG